MYYSSKSVGVTVSYKIEFSDTDKDYMVKECYDRNWYITVYCKGNRLDCNGMLADYDNIAQFIFDTLDSKDLNEVFDFNPTLEAVAAWLYEQIVPCYKVEISSEEETVSFEEENN